MLLWSQVTRKIGENSLGVRQTFESSSDGGKTWTVSFDGFYKKGMP